MVVSKCRFKPFPRLTGSVGVQLLNQIWESTEKGLLEIVDAFVQTNALQLVIVQRVASGFVLGHLNDIGKILHGPQYLVSVRLSVSGDLMAPSSVSPDIRTGTETREVSVQNTYTQSKCKPSV